eukprot:539861_1
MLVHLIILLPLIHNIFSQRTVSTKSVRLTPSATYVDGVSIITGFNEVQLTNNQWLVTTTTQNRWHFIMFIDQSFAFDPYLTSQLKITINTNQNSWYPGNELLFGFTSTNTQYISAYIPMSPEVNEYLPNQIYPACNQSPLSGQPFAPGDIASIPKYDRSCDIAGGSCANWRNMIPPNIGHTPQKSFSFILQNRPLTNNLDISFDSTSYPPGLLQTCTFGTTFPINTRGLKIYIASNDPGSIYTINSFDIESILIEPTPSPTPAPTNNPTNNPTPSPTQYPTPTPTGMPTPTPTNIPTSAH